MEYFHPELNQIIRVMRVLGERFWFERCAVWSALGAFVTAIYQSVVKISRRLVSLLATAIGIVFLKSYSVLLRSRQVRRFQSGFTILTWGNAGFLIFLLFLVILYRKTDDKTLNNVYLVLKSAKCFI